MKKVFLIGLLALVGALGFMSSAQAQSRFCFHFPDDPRCAPRYFDDGFYDDESDIPMWDDGFDRPRRPRHEDSGTITLQFGSGKSCNKISRSLQRSGYRRVKAVDCAGRDYAFTAIRDGERLRIGVKSATGRIFRIEPY